MFVVNGNANVAYDVVSTNVSPDEVVLSRPAVVVDRFKLPTVNLSICSSVSKSL